VGARNSVRRCDLLVFVVGRSRGRADPRLELPSIRFARGNIDLVSNRSVSARAATGLHKHSVEGITQNRRSAT
jgi:hypothetical protein